MLVVVSSMSHLAIDHDGLFEKLDAIEKLSNSLKIGSKVDKLVDAWKEYQTLMLPHLQEEEDMALPLYRAYFSEAEATLIEQMIMAKATKLEIGAIVFFAGADKIRNDFMKVHKIPGFVWYIEFRGRYNFFLKEIVTAAEALKLGQAPVPSRCFWL